MKDSKIRSFGLKKTVSATVCANAIDNVAQFAEG